MLCFCVTIHSEKWAYVMKPTSTDTLWITDQVMIISCRRSLGMCRDAWSSITWIWPLAFKVVLVTNSRIRQDSYLDQYVVMLSCFQTYLNGCLKQSWDLSWVILSSNLQLGDCFYDLSTTDLMQICCGTAQFLY